MLKNLEHNLKQTRISKNTDKKTCYVINHLIQYIKKYRKKSKKVKQSFCYYYFFKSSWRSKRDSVGGYFLASRSMNWVLVSSIFKYSFFSFQLLNIPFSVFNFLIFVFQFSTFEYSFFSFQLLNISFSVFNF